MDKKTKRCPRGSRRDKKTKKCKKVKLIVNPNTWIPGEKTKVLQDGMNFKLLMKVLDSYTRLCEDLKEVNKLLKGKGKSRMPNFMSEISENIVKFALAKIYGYYPNWNSKKGDLEVETVDKKLIQLEIKGFMSDGPLSFGPNEDWDIIYFVDAKDFINKKFKIYEIKLSNRSDIWRKIKISGQEFNLEDIPELPDNLEELNLKQLKDICDKRGILKTGKKTDIITRLKTKKPGSKFEKKPLKTFGEIADENKRGLLRGAFYTIFKKQLGEYCKLIFNGHISELDDTV